jgi:hypothetical protein
MAAIEILPWYRRHAIQIAAALPETTEDALIVLRLTTELVEGVFSWSENRSRPEQGL